MTTGKATLNFRKAYFLAVGEAYVAVFYLLRVVKG